MTIDPRIREYAGRADEVDAGEALDVLIRIFIDACGVSLGERCVAFCASNYWRSRWMDQNPELPRNISWRKCMEMRSDYYRENKECLDSYSYGNLDPIEALNNLSTMLDDYRDDTTRIILSIGILFYTFFMLKSIESDD